MPSTARAPRRMYDFEGAIPLVHSDIEPAHVHHPDCDPRPVPWDWHLIRYVLKLALAVATIVAVLVLTPVPVRSAPLGPRMAEATCDLIRYYVSVYGLDRALAWARKNGYKRADILAAFRCLRAKP